MSEDKLDITRLRHDWFMVNPFNVEQAHMDGGTLESAGSSSKASASRLMSA